MADFGLTEVDAVSAQLIESLVQKFLIQEAKLMPLVQNFSGPKGAKSIKIPRGGSLTADTKVENVAATAQTFVYAQDELLLNLHKVIQVVLEDSAQIQATPDIVSDIIERMAKTLALDIDTSIVSILETPSAAGPDHRLAYANATSLGKADLLVARKLIHAQNLNFNECFIGVNPVSEADLLAVDDFVHVDKYGANADGLRNGELGRLYGAPVIMSNEFDALKTIVWHPTMMAFARQIEPKFERFRDVPKLADLYSFSNLYGVKLLDSGVRGVMLGTAA